MYYNARGKLRKFNLKGLKALLICYDAEQKTVSFMGVLRDSERAPVMLYFQNLSGDKDSGRLANDKFSLWTMDRGDLVELAKLIANLLGWHNVTITLTSPEGSNKTIGVVRIERTR